MHDVHPAALTVMLGAAAVSAACALAAGRAVPWQGKQTALVMLAGMLVLALPDAGVPPVLVAAVWMLSAMVGTAGLRDSAAAADCRHRSFGGIAMTLCLMGGAARLPDAAAHSSHAHSLGFALPVLGAVAVLTVVVWTAVGIRAGAQTGRTALLLRAEAWAMTLGLIAMWLGHAPA